VDKIGGLDAAIKEAAVLGKTKKYTTQNYPEYNKDVNDLLAGFLCPIQRKFHQTRNWPRKL
jgi:protease-4